jgi:hypothetical protein
MNQKVAFSPITRFTAANPGRLPRAVVQLI